MHKFIHAAGWSSFTADWQKHLRLVFFFHATLAHFISLMLSDYCSSRSRCVTCIETGDVGVSFFFAAGPHRGITANCSEQLLSHSGPVRSRAYLYAPTRLGLVSIRETHSLMDIVKQCRNWNKTR